MYTVPCNGTLCKIYIVQYGTYLMFLLLQRVDLIYSVQCTMYSVKCTFDVYVIAQSGMVNSV